MKNGFTLIELVVSITIIAILSAVILFATAQYINKGKDSNVSGNLAVLIPAGEAYYNIDNTYGTPTDANFCNSDAVVYIKNQLSVPAAPVVCPDTEGMEGLCCFVADDGRSWMACAQEFTVPVKSYCVDSRGVKKEICTTSCTADSDLTQCPQDVLADCD